MSLLKKSFCMFLLGLVALSGITYGDEIDAIYKQIRYSGPTYQWEESIVSFTNKGMTLVCSLTVPKITRSRPIIITLNGFGGTRDEATIPGTEEGILKRTARILAEQGICSLRVDFRGAGDSDGTYDMTTFSGQVSDVLKAIDFVQTLNDPVNPDRIGIIGFSQGGLVGSATAAVDERVKSLVLWSAPAYPPHDYEGLLTKAGLKQGLSLKEGETITVPVYVEGQYYWDVTLGKMFFDGLFQICPLAEIKNYENPMMYIAGVQDVIVWPQPHIGDTFLKYHEGNEKLVLLDADHAFNFWDGPVPGKLDDAIYWSTAWFMATLKNGRN
jgi:pimeloyl-ACP methyl ester carboxylesterase